LQLGVAAQASRQNIAALAGKRSRRRKKRAPSWRLLKSAKAALPAAPTALTLSRSLCSPLRDSLRERLRFGPFKTEEGKFFLFSLQLKVRAKKEKICWGCARARLMPRARWRAGNLSAKGGIMHLTDCFNRFQLFLQVSGLAKSSRESYARTLQKFTDYLEYSGKNSEVTAIRKEDVLEFLACCEENGEKRSTTLLRLLTLKKFFGWLKGEREIAENPTERIPIPKETKRIPRYVSPAQVEAMLNKPDLKTPWGLRDRALMELIYSAGLRISEALDLQIGDINYEQGFLYIRKGKGGDPRSVPFGTQAAEWLKRYTLEGRKKLEQDCSSFLFLSRSGQRLSRQSAAAAIRAYARSAGLPSWLTPHSLRHAAATHMLEGGARLSYIQEMLGHKRINSTQIYMAVRSEGLKEVHAACHPRG
jgi:integrase/recombinase XerD